MTTTAPSIPATPTPAAALLVSARLRALGYALLAALAYVPVMLTSPGRVVADTKSYLYLDPSRLLERAPSMWDPNIGLGTVTHQNIGYLFPMGPYYWLMDTLGFPAWVSQRLWLGTILLAAGLGVLYLMRTLAVRGPGVPVAALVFMLTPYSLDFASRISVILLPWAALPWMVAIMVRALRDDRGWRYPAIFAIVVQVVGGVNATALIFAGIAPALWVLHAVYVTREIRVRRAFAVLAKVGLLTFLASLWWLAGLSIQSGYGLNVLRYTETLETVSTASLANEVLRGLGYWFFYGRDKLGPWTESSVGYTQHIWLILVGYAVPVLAIAGAALVRWKHRVFFVALVLVGVTVAVGAHPYDDPSPFGALFKSFAADSSFGLALRSTGRAVPLLVLGLAVLLGAAVNVVAERWGARDQASSRDGARIGRGRARGLVLAGVIGALAIANLPALWNGTFYGKNLQRDEDVPAYWTQAIGDLDAGPHDTRVLEIPGADFAAYRWGNTVDPITPGLMDRPYVARELIPWGSPASADLLNALDRRLQEGVLDPSAIAPVARLLGVGDVVYRADLQTDRFDLPRSRPTWLLLSDPVPAGLGTPKPYGDSLGPPLTFAQQDEVALALPPSSPEPAPVVVFPVEDAPSIVRTAAAGAPLLVSGDGEGLVDLAVLGALDGSRPVLYSASFAGDGAALRKQVDAPESTLVVTDSNRKRGRRWGAIKDVEGATERAGETALTKDEADNRLDVFPDASTDANTVVESPGARVSTTRYGNRITYWPEQRGARAFDGDVSTAWQVGTHAKAIGEKLRLDLDEPITTDHVNLVQRQVGDTRRSVTAVTLAFDGGDPVTVPLDDSSRTPDGQTVTFPRRTFRRLEVTIADTSDHDVLDGPVNNVGFAQIRVRDDAPGATDVRVDEIVRMPTDLVRHAPRSTVAERPLVYVMTRSRNVVIPPRDSQDEMALVRKFLVPNDRAFSYRGRARLATDAPDDVLDSLLGFPDAETGGITVTASQHLDGSVAARGSAALDGDPATAWNTKFGAPAGQWVDVRTPAPVTFDRLDLQVVADGRHSVPTQLRIDAGGESRTVDVPTVSDSTQENATATVPVTFAPLTGDDVRVTVTGLRPIVTTEYHELQPIVMPVGIAELGIPGVRRGPLPAALPDTCRTDLVALDGEPLPVRLDGSPADAQALQPVDLARVRWRAHRRRPRGGEPRRALGARARPGRRRRRPHTGIRRRGRAAGARRQRLLHARAALRGEGSLGACRPQREDQARARRDGGDAGRSVLADARPESERRLASDGGRRRPGRLHPRRRLHERLAGDADIGPFRRHAHVDASAPRVVRARDLGSRAASVPRARAPRAAPSPWHEGAGGGRRAARAHEPARRRRRPTVGVSARRRDADGRSAGRVPRPVVGRSGRRGGGAARGAPSPLPLPAHVRGAGRPCPLRPLRRGAAIPLRVRERLRLAHELRARPLPCVVGGHPPRIRRDRGACPHGLGAPAVCTIGRLGAGT